MANYSMLDLFRQEVDAQVASLKQSLTMLKQQPDSLPDLSLRELEDGQRALKTIDALAQVVGVEAAATVVQAIQQNLHVAQQGTPFPPELLDRLLEAADWLTEIAHLEPTDRENWLFHHQPAIVALQSPAAAVPPSYPSTHPPVHPSTPPPVHPSTPPLPTPHSPLPTPHSPLPLLRVDAQMMDLFRLEVEEQARILNDGLLTLEAEPTAIQPLEALMRSAHSIKGAARIVGLDAAVNLAHTMEDCFVAAQERTLTLSANLVDQLLRGVDLLQELSHISDRDLPEWFAQHDNAIAAVRSMIESLRQSPADLQTDTQTDLQANTQISPPAPSPDRSAGNSSNLLEISASENGRSPAQTNPRKPVLVAARSPSGETAQQTIDSQRDSSTRDAAASGTQRVVRVSADNLNRIMGLAGESLIEANALPAFANALMKVRSHQIELATSLDALEQRLLGESALSPIEQVLLERVRQQERQCRSLLSDRVSELEEFIRRTTNLSDRLYREVITSHMRPFEEGVQNFSRMVRDLARSLNKQARLEIIGRSTTVDRDILARLETPITHILRNAIDHGIELPEDRIAAGKSPEGRIRLEAAHRGGMLTITVSDDGTGINVQRLRQKAIDRQLIPSDMASRLSDAELMEFLFLPGFTLSRQVTELSGRGVGLDIVKSMAQEVGGTVRVTSQPGKGTAFHFQLPLTLSVVRTLLVEVAGEVYAFPLSRIDQIVALKQSDISVVENRQYFTLEEQNIGLIPLYQVLDLPPPQNPSESYWVVVLSDQSDPYGLIVDRCLGERELVVRPLDSRLGKLQDVSAAALMGDGSLVLILDVSDLIRSINGLLGNGKLAKVGETRSSKQGRAEAKRVLVVDDSITVREMERKLLQNHGYIVDVAVDGMEAWNAVRSYPYDLVISDIDMPRMNGIDLIKQIKRHSRFQSIPVIVVSYRDRENDRIQGLEAGADYYLTKNSFHDDTLIRAVTDLIGE